MSPANFTKPPIGIQPTFQRVPWRSVQPKISRPKPIEKTSAFTPNIRPAR